MKNLKKGLSLFALLAIFLSIASGAQAAPKFRRPLSITPTITSFYDNNSSSPGTKKYSCSTTGTYDGHKGTDFSAVVGTSIYAAANGGVYSRYDNCDTYGYLGSTCGSGYGNNARIDHEGDVTDGVGWVTIYAHMKKGTVVWPMSVTCGSNIGKTGSSGNSSGPHLHFEVKKYAYPGNDPFSGSCSHTGSFWVNQNNGAPTTACQQ